MTPFDPTADDLARIDRARAEVWLTAHEWEACPWMMPERAGCWWRLRRGPQFEHYSELMPATEAADAPRRWMGLLRAVSHAHDLHGLALWAVLVAWQAPGPVEVDL